MRTSLYIASVTFLGLCAGQIAFGQASKPAPVNAYRGMQEREEVFEFTEKPKVVKQGDKWIITFASKAACDATVSILDKDGKIIRHLASGVLGVNAPHPFQQNSLSQKIKWDGLTDDFRKADPAGCVVKVSLGLMATYERSLLWDPLALPDELLSGTGPDGNFYVGIAGRHSTWGYVFDKRGKYLRTFCPAPAAEVEKDGEAPPDGYGGMVVQERYMGVVAENGGIPPVTTTDWGDKVMISGWFGPFSHPKILEARFAKLGVTNAKEGPRPTVLPASKLPSTIDQNQRVTNIAQHVFAKITHLSVDRRHELLYAGFDTIFRFDGKTGEFDATWFANAEMGKTISEFHVGPDGLLYIRAGGSSYGQHMFRIDRSGQTVPFETNTADVPEEGWWEWRPRAFKSGALGAVFCGVRGHSNTFQQGLHVAPSGQIVTSVHEVDAKWGLERRLATPSDVKGDEIPGTYNLVFGPDGDLLTANAVEGRWKGHGVGMDRDGNIYIVLAGTLPAGQKALDGTPDFPAGDRVQGGYGTLIKFQSQGGKYPIGKIVRGKEPAPAGAIQLSNGYALGALWAYGGVTGQSEGCSCHHQRFDMDPWARAWIPSGHLFSVVVLDSNGNRIVRLGRYGNVDDTEADVRAKQDGLRFAWVRAVAASDTSLYVADTGNGRILKAAISYAAEETVPLP